MILRYLVAVVGALAITIGLLIFMSDMTTGIWIFRMDGFQGWNGEQWGMPDISSVQKWDEPVKPRVIS